MGTSSAFGGSKAWKKAVSSAVSGVDGTASANVSSEFGRALGAALRKGHKQGGHYSVSDLLASNRGSRGSSASGQGREGGGAPPFSRDAARGALVFAAVEAVEAGDVDGLAELGIELSTLEGLTGPALFAQLVALILGPASHPDDLALSQSVITTLSTAVPGSTLGDRIAQFVAALAWQKAAVQLSVDKGWRTRARNSVRAYETKIKGWIRARVSSIAQNLTNRSPQQVANYASDLAVRACQEFTEG